MVVFFKFFIFSNFQILLKSKSSLRTTTQKPIFIIYHPSTYLTPFIVLPQRNFQRCWCSSVGRAWDWRSQGRWFDPGHQHFFSFSKNRIIKIFKIKSRRNQSNFRQFSSSFRVAYFNPRNLVEILRNEKMCKILALLSKVLVL